MNIIILPSERSRLKFPGPGTAFWCVQAYFNPGSAVPGRNAVLQLHTKVFTYFSALSACQHSKTSELGLNCARSKICDLRSYTSTLNSTVFKCRLATFLLGSGL